MTLKKVYKRVRTAIIYEIVCLTTGERYIGSTITTLQNRKSKHYKNNNTLSKKIIERNNYIVNELETFNTRFELAVLLKEQYYIENTENINKNRALDIYNKIRKKRNRDLAKKSRIINKEKINNYRVQYYLINKDLLNKTKRDKRRNEKKIKCKCGGKYTENHKNRHFQTIKHKKYLDSL